MANVNLPAKENNPPVVSSLLRFSSLPIAPRVYPNPLLYIYTQIDLPLAFLSHGIPLHRHFHRLFFVFSMRTISVALGIFPLHHQCASSARDWNFGETAVDRKAGADRREEKQRLVISSSIIASTELTTQLTAD